MADVQFAGGAHAAEDAIFFGWNGRQVFPVMKSFKL
jgi:hypothetical protein